MKNEDELVEEVLKGDHASFEAILRPYRTGFLNMAYRMTGNSEEANEICQEALIKIFRHLRSFKKGSSFKGWAYKIVVNCTYDFLRKRRVEVALGQQELLAAGGGSNPEELYSRREIRDKVELCLRTLSPRQKAIFLLRDREGFSIRETSKVLGCSAMSVRTHLSHARRKIREQFQRKFPLPAQEVKR